jgi:hypothetical protein
MSSVHDAIAPQAPRVTVVPGAPAATENVLRFAGGDVADALPPTARELFVQLRQASEDAHAISLSLSDRIRDTMQRRQAIETRVRQLKLGRGAGGYGETDESQSVVAEREKLAVVVRDLEEAQRLQADRQARFQPAKALSDRLETFLENAAREASGAKLMLHVPIAPQLKKGETLPQAISRHRETIAALRQQRSDLLAAPIALAQAKAAMRAEVDALAQRGRCDATALLWPPADARFPNSISWPVREESQPGGMVTQSVDTLGIVMALLKPQVIAALDQQLTDAAAALGEGLTDEQRRAQLADVSAELLRLERQECALVRQAIADGVAAAYRPEADPRAVLGLVDAAGARFLASK